MNHQPLLRLLVPANHEGNWSDLLGTMIETDPLPMLRVLGLGDHTGLRVSREWTVAWKDAKGKRRGDRVDLVLTSVTGGGILAVIEVKVLAPVGADQLERYADSISAGQYRLLQLQRFEVPPRQQGWESLTWEDVLDAYSSSEHTWIAATARAWLAQMSHLVPDIDGSTLWRDVRDGAEGDIDLRARGAWLYSQMPSWCSVDHGFSETTGGRSWVVLMEAQTSRPGYSVGIELDEGLPVWKWNDPNSDLPRADRLEGPTILVGLIQQGVEDALSFDWRLLKNLFRSHVLNAQGAPRDGRAWRTGSARRGHLPEWQRHIRDSDTVPNWLGQGYDMSKDKWCMFGARFNLKPGMPLAEIDTELRRTEELVRAFAAQV